MARFGSGEIDRGRVTLKQASAGLVIAHFEPTADTLRQLRLSDGEEVAPVKILEIDIGQKRIRIYPIGTHPTIDIFSLPKYEQVRMLSVPFEPDGAPTTAEDIQSVLENLPRGFLKDYQYGLGLPVTYSFLIRAIEKQTKCTEIYFTKGDPSKVEGECLFLSLEDFESARAEMDRINSRAQRAASNVKEASAHNWLLEITGNEAVPYKRGRNPMIQAFADAAAGNETFDEKDMDDLINVLEVQSKRISASRPAGLAKLRADIELVELDALISRFADMLVAKTQSEDAWQVFFVENPFILSFSFAYPLILVQDQAAVGGRKLSGSGEKIADFLLKNPVTDNVAIFEIKKPSTPLMKQVEYRGGVYGPSSDLSGSIVQILDQRYHLASDFAAKQRASRIYDIESFSINLCLIIGRTPDELDQAKSFELFRHSMTDVNIVTFDELFERIKLLRSFLNGSEGADKSPADTQLE